MLMIRLFLPHPLMHALRKMMAVAMLAYSSFIVVTIISIATVNFLFISPCTHAAFACIHLQQTVIANLMNLSLIRISCCYLTLIVTLLQ